MRRTDWKRTSGRTQGRSHAKDAIPCQDAIRTCFKRNVHCIALADGAGSAALSHIGSSLCVKTLCNELCCRFDSLKRLSDDGLSDELVSCIKSSLLEFVGEGADIRPFASTALAVAVKKNRYIAAHLGDGVIGLELISKNGLRHLQTLSSPDNGEHSNETFFTTSKDAANRMRIYRGVIKDDRRMITGFVLMSDGPESALYRKTDSALAPACTKLLDSTRVMKRRPLMRGVENAMRLIADQKTFDDCSIALMAHV